MKLGSANLTNTQREILEMLLSGHAISTGEIVIAFYPQTRRFQNKCQTFQRHMRRLERLGKVKCVSATYEPAQSLWTKA